MAGDSNVPVLKMECITVLKHPETHVNVGKYVEKTWNESTGTSRLCRHSGHTLMIGVLLILTVVSFVSQLWLYIHVQSLNKQVQSQNDQIKEQGQMIDNLLVRLELQRKLEESKERNPRTVSTTTPHFYLKGNGRTENGVFTWKPPQDRSFARLTDHFWASINANHNDLSEVAISQKGTYLVIAKMMANGRIRRDSDVPPPMGIALMKKKGNGSPIKLDEAWTTQDERGRRYPMPPSAPVDRSYPIDTVTVIGFYNLDVNDRIYVQKPVDSLYDPYGERYINGEDQAQFGAFLVEGSLS